MRNIKPRIDRVDRVITPQVDPRVVIIGSIRSIRPPRMRRIRRPDVAKFMQPFCSSSKIAQNLFKTFVVSAGFCTASIRIFSRPYTSFSIFFCFFDAAKLFSNAAIECRRPFTGVLVACLDVLIGNSVLSANDLRAKNQQGCKD